MTFLFLLAFLHIFKLSEQVAPLIDPDRMYKSAKFVVDLNQKLLITPFKTYDVKNSFECTENCLSHDECLSFNIAKVAVGGLKVCQLLSIDKKDSPAHFKASADFHYYDSGLGLPKHCADAKKRDPSAVSGNYLVKTSNKELKVYCDMDNFGGGWTLVASISHSNKNHIKRQEVNCEGKLCVPYKDSGFIPTRKLSDWDIHQLAIDEGTFRLEVKVQTPYSVFYRIPSGAENFDSSCYAQLCPRIAISHHHPYQWEYGCAGTTGYKISTNSYYGKHYVFDGHDNGACSFYSSQYQTYRALYAYSTCNGIMSAFLCLIWHNSEVTAKQCNVFSSTYGYYFKDHLEQSIHDASLENCTTSCFDARFCKSTNFNFQNRTCELNNADKHDFPKDYTERQGYSYSGWREKEQQPMSCADVKKKNALAKSGYYFVQTGNKSMTVYCDMEKYDGGWTLVASISASNRDHLQKGQHNCLNPSLCVEYKSSDIKARKLSDEDIIQLIPGKGTFRIDVLSGNHSPYTIFYKLPGGSKNFDSSCDGTTPPICPRIIISHYYPYRWETSRCKTLDVGYRIANFPSHRVFDGHDDGECGGEFRSSLYPETRVLYGYVYDSYKGIYANREGLLFVK